MAGMSSGAGGAPLGMSDRKRVMSSAGGALGAVAVVVGGTRLVAGLREGGEPVGAVSLRKSRERKSPPEGEPSILPMPSGVAGGLATLRMFSTKSPRLMAARCVFVSARL